MNDMLRKLLWVIAFFALITVAQAQLQTVSIIADNTELCEGSSTQLSVIIGTNGTLNLQVTWTPDYNISSVDVLQPIVNPKHTTVYRAVVYDLDNETSMEAEITISVVPKPIVVTPNGWDVCANEPISLAPEQFDHSLSPSWTHNGQGIFLNSIDGLNVTYIPAENEIGVVQFVLTGEGIDLCENVSDTTTVTIVPATTAEIRNSEIFICSNSTLAINGVAENYDSIIWSHDGKGQLVGENTLNPTYIPDSNESGNVNVVMKAIGSTCVVSDTFSFEVSAIAVEFNNEIEACEGDRVILNITALNTVSYLWNNGETGNQIIVDAEESDVYVAEVTNDRGCTTEAVIRLEVNEQVYVSIESDLKNRIITVYPEGLARYEIWDRASSELLYSGESNSFDYSALPVSVKEIYAIGVDELGCKSDSENAEGDNIFVVSPDLMKVNAFSPNGDGVNDRLLPGRKTRVFDRTSKILYEGWDGWNGKYNGKSMPQGTYFYILFDDNNKVFYKGPVTILR